MLVKAGGKNKEGRQRMRWMDGWMDDVEDFRILVVVIGKQRHKNGTAGESFQSLPRPTTGSSAKTITSTTMHFTSKVQISAQLMSTTPLLLRLLRMVETFCRFLT